MIWMICVVYANLQSGGGIIGTMVNTDKMSMGKRENMFRGHLKQFRTLDIKFCHNTS